MSALRNFVFTLNNYTEEEVNQINNFDCKYMIYGKEVGESGTPHLQGYCELHKQIRFGTLHTLFPRMHIEARKGKQVDAINYCKKQDQSPFEKGERRRQGQRTDLCKVRECALDGGMRAVTATYNLQQIGVAKAFLTYNEEPRDWKPKVIWITGESGLGKSRAARELTKDEDVFVKNDGTKWWDGYDGHETVILDDYRDSWCSITEMLSLLDRYEKRVEIKGGWRQFKPTKIVITSIRKPSECYLGIGECAKQLARRIDKIITMSRDVTNVFVTKVEG